jgi:hypothetical protein
MDEAGASTAEAAIAEPITSDAAPDDDADWDAPAAAFRACPRRVARHTVANGVVTMEGAGRARASCRILLFTGLAKRDALPLPSAATPLIGTHHDRLVRTDRGWSFATRRGSPDFRAPQ